MTTELDLVHMLRSDAGLDVAAVARVRGELQWTARAAGVDAPSLRPIVPYLIYDDVERALRWLTDAFGFDELRDARFVDERGAIQHAELELHGARVMIGPPSVHGDSPSRGVSAMLDVAVADVDAHHRRATAAGARVVIDLEDAPWGVRRYQAADVEGHQWQFSQPIGS